MAKNNRYCLVYHFKNGDKRVVKITFEDGKVRQTFALTEIDFMTSLFPNSDAFARFVQIDGEEAKDGYFAIEYKSNNKINSLELVFSDMKFINSLAKKYFGESNLSKEDILSYMRWFLDKIDKDSEFLDFISTHRYTNGYFKAALSEYLILKDSYENDARSILRQAEVKLTKEFMRYKTIRGLEVGRRNYELMKANKIVPRNPNELTSSEIARKDYELNHPKKVKKRSKLQKEIDNGQMVLFDVSSYTDSSIFEPQKKR